MVTIGILLPDLKSYVKYTTLPSHMGILMIIYGLHNIYFFIYITYILSVCNVVCSDVAYGTAAAIHRTITWEMGQRRQLSRSSESDRLPQNTWLKNSITFYS